MAEKRPWVILDSDSFPEHTNIYVGLRETKGGARIDGQVKLLFRKDDDENTDVALMREGGKEEYVAEVKIGDFRFSDWDIRGFADEGYNTLVVSTIGGEKIIARKLNTEGPRASRDNSSRASTQQAPLKKEEFVKLFLHLDPPQEVRDAAGKLSGYTVAGFVTASKGREQYSDKKVEFLINGEVAPNCPRELKNGKASYIFEVEPKGRVHLSARLEGTSIEDTKWDVLVPAETPKASKPKAYAITARLERPHPVNGKFMVEGASSVDGKLATCQCTLSTSPDDATVEARLGSITQNADLTTYSLTPSNAGKYKLAVQIPGDSIALTVSAPDGTSDTVHLVKPK